LSRSVSRVCKAMGSLRCFDPCFICHVRFLGWRRRVNASLFGNLHIQPHLEQNCRVFAAIWPRSRSMCAPSEELSAGQGVKRGGTPMTKLFAGAAAAILFAGAAIAGEQATETEIVEAAAAVEAIESEAVEIEAVEVEAAAEAEVGPAVAEGDDSVTEEAAAD